MRRRRQKGFTLIEILVAFVVLAVVGGALLELFQGGLRNIGLSGEYSHASLLARSKLSELRSRSQLPMGESSGTFDDTYEWQMTVEPYVDENGEAPRRPA